MWLLIVDLLPFVLSSSVALILIYLRIPTNFIQQIVAVLLALLLIFLTRLPAADSSYYKKRFYRVVVIFIISVFMQLLVIATGGFFSPLLILLHLMTIGLSFLLNVRSSVTFLVLSIIVLIFNIQFDKTMYILFKEDTSSVILYGISFLVIIPLAQSISRTYHIKDTLSKRLKEYLHLSQVRQESILRGLNDYVVVTDVNLNILSANDAIQKILKTSQEEMVHKPFLSIVPLADQNHNLVTSQTFSIANVIKDKYTRLISGLYFYPKPNINPTKVDLQIRPIVDSGGEINQLVFVITESVTAGFQKGHQDLDQARFREKAVFEEVKKAMAANDTKNATMNLELLKKIEEDLLIAQEVEDHLIKYKSNDSLEDLAWLCKQSVDRKASLAKSFNLSLIFSLLGDEQQEIYYLQLKENNTPIISEEISSFSVLIDAKWFGVLIDKLIDIAILLSYNQPARQIQISLKRNPDMINILITCPSFPLPEDYQQDLFSEYYGGLGLNSTLRFGSGLEGFIAKSIANQLNIKIDTRLDNNPTTVVTSLILNKKVD